MLLSIYSEIEDEIIRHVFSTRKPLLSHKVVQCLFPKQWKGSHACALWSFFCDNKHSVQHKTNRCIFTAFVMVLQIKGIGRKSDDMASFSRSCCWVLYIDSSVSHLDMFVLFMRWSQFLFKQSPRIYLATMLKEDWWSSSSSFIIFHVTLWYHERRWKTNN